jgi:hypothetical protein
MALGIHPASSANRQPIIAANYHTFDYEIQPCGCAALILGFPSRNQSAESIQVPAATHSVQPKQVVVLCWC